MKKFIFLIFSFNSIIASASGQWSLNDVSILLPLPETSQYSALLAPASEGPLGLLLPKDIYDRFPPLSSFAEPQTLYTNNLKVIGIRLDPCFQEGVKAPCQKQIRLIWQPLFELREETTTADAALHSFYQFDDLTWEKVILAWNKIKLKKPADSLQIHPQISAEGFDGKTWIQLKNIILNFCGDKNLIRVTGMKTNAQRVWIFQGFDRIDSKWVALSIPNIGTKKTQTFMTTPDGLFELEEFESSIFPLPDGSRELSLFLANSANYKANRSQEDIKKIFIQALQIENPKIHNPGTVDCVSCHIAQTTQLWVERNFSTTDWDLRSHRYQSPLSLKNNSINPANTNRVRSFGYFNNESIFSQRVINESSEVVESLNHSTR